MKITNVRTRAIEWRAAALGNLGTRRLGLARGLPLKACPLAGHHHAIETARLRRRIFLVLGFGAS